MRSSSVSIPSSALINPNIANSNSFPLNNYNLNNTIIKSKVKIIDRDTKSGNNFVNNNLPHNATVSLRSSLGSYHKHAQSYNNLYSNIQMNNSNTNFISNKIIDKSPDIKSNQSVQDSKNNLKISNSKLPSINTIDKNKIKKLINSSSSNNLLFKFYKQNSQNSINANSSLTNHIFGKKKLGVPNSYINYNQ